MMKRIEILNSLERGEISVDKAVSLLKNCHKKELAEASDKKFFPRKARWFRIFVNDGGGHRIKLYAPISLVNLGFSLGKVVIGSKHMEDNEGIQTARAVLNSINSKDMKQLVRAIKEAGKTDIVQVNDGNTFVNISIV